MKGLKDEIILSALIDFFFFLAIAICQLVYCSCPCGSHLPCHGWWWNADKNSQVAWRDIVNTVTATGTAGISDSPVTALGSDDNGFGCSLRCD